MEDESWGPSDPGPIGLEKRQDGPMWVPVVLILFILAVSAASLLWLPVDDVAPLPSECPVTGHVEATVR